MACHAGSRDSLKDSVACGLGSRGALPTAQVQLQLLKLHICDCEVQVNLFGEFSHKFLFKPL